MSQHTINRASVEAAAVGTRYRVKNDESVDFWRKASADSVEFKGDTLPLSAIFGWADTNSLIAYDENVWLPGEWRTQRRTELKPDTGVSYLVLADHRNNAYVAVAKFTGTRFDGFMEVNAGGSSDYQATPKPEGMEMMWAFMRAMIRRDTNWSANIDGDEKQGLLNAGPALLKVADEVDSEVLDKYLVERGLERPGLVAQVTVKVSGKHTMTPSLGNNVEAAEVKVPVSFEFTYEAVGKGCQCRQPSREGVAFDDLVTQRGVEVKAPKIEVSCSHDEAA